MMKGLEYVNRIIVFMTSRQRLLGAIGFESHWNLIGENRAHLFFMKMRRFILRKKTAFTVIHIYLRLLIIKF